MCEDETNLDTDHGNPDASQSSPVEDFNYANIDPVLFLPQTDAANIATTGPRLLDTPMTDMLPDQDTYNTRLPVPPNEVLPFRPVPNTYQAARAFDSPEHITFPEMVYSGWIQEGDAYLLRLDLPSTLTPTRSHPNIPRFHTKVFYAYVTKVEAGTAFVSPDALYLQSIEVRDPQEIVEAMGRENFDHIGSFCEMQDPWILEVVRLGSSRGTLREDRERYWRWKMGR
ncbi:hypothetical protein MMC18_005265 [Xylographa bjoerkii]|nr:hypothetical protein [Xylographa bjoerkii]